MYGDGLVGFGMVLGGLGCFNGPHDGYANRSNSKMSLPRAKGWPYRFTDCSASRCRFTHDILAQSLYIRPATADRNKY